MKFLREHSLAEEQDIRAIGEQLVPYIQHCGTIASADSYDAPESSLRLPHDDIIARNVLNAVKGKVSPQLKYIVLIGIGGSNLGAKAVYDAKFGYADILNPDRFPKIIFAESLDAPYVSRLARFLQERAISPEEILLIMASKSGGTLETIANAEYILGSLKTRFRDILKRVVIITDKNSGLWKEATEKGIVMLETPAMVGGRYSVFSAMGLFPLAAAGIDISALLDGARRSLEQCLRENALANPAAISAAIQFFHFKKGISLRNLFFFCPELESAGKWERQLVAESLGKEHDDEGNEIRAGITPVVSIAPPDLHSMLQLYLAGPRDKFTTFVSNESGDKSVSVPADQTVFQSLGRDIRGKSFDELTGTILRNVQESYLLKGLPFSEIILENTGEASLGEFLQFHMAETMFLANLLRINAFDQPDVEAYKRKF